MGGGGGEKTEQATTKRKQDERKKGNVFKSQEIIILGSLLVVIFTIQALGGVTLTALNQAFERFWTLAGTLGSISPADLRELFIQGAGVYLVAALPALLAAAVAAVVLTMAQTRGLVSTELLKPKFSKLNPINGIKKMFSLRGLMELLKSIVKIIVLGYVIFNEYQSRFNELPRLMEMDFRAVLSYTGEFIMSIVVSVAVIYAALSAVDYLFQRWQYERDLRMSKQEIKEEYKQTEGDPQIKGKIKEKQRQMSMARMMQSVPEADVIIRNPTHYAVAVKYDAGRARAPLVLAKGQDLLALRIIKKAEEAGVMLMENPSLARSLYENVPLEAEIPEEFYGPVAEVLAFVYAQQKRGIPTAEDVPPS